MGCHGKRVSSSVVPPSLLHLELTAPTSDCRGNDALEALFVRFGVDMFKTCFVPNPLELSQLGLHFQAVVQKPGDAMLVTARTFAWAQVCFLGLCLVFASCSHALFKTEGACTAITWRIFPKRETHFKLAWESHMINIRKVCFSEEGGPSILCVWLHTQPPNTHYHTHTHTHTHTHYHTHATETEIRDPDGAADFQSGTELQPSGRPC
jgi:hypothetical protein